MKNKISKISFYVTALVLLVGSVMYYFAQWYGFVVLVSFSEFISPVILILLLINKIFFHAGNNRFFYLSIIINLLFIVWAFYINYHFYDNFNLMML